MNTKAVYQVLLQAACDRTTISYGEIIGLAGLTLTGDAFTTYLVPDASRRETWLSPAPTDPSVAHEDKR